MLVALGLEVLLSHQLLTLPPCPCLGEESWG